MEREAFHSYARGDKESYGLNRTPMLNVRGEA